jgi:hypothetical protein
MSEKKYTNGPWWLYESEKKIEIRPYITSGERGCTLGFAPIASVAGDKRTIDDDKRIANARLISSAPDLLEALEDVLREARTGNINPETLQKAVAAIQKAYGAEI